MFLGLHARAATDRDYNSHVHDLRYAVRYLWMHKSFTATAVLTLAIGLGANTALYGLLNAALRPLPLPHAEQIVTIAAETKNDETGRVHVLVLDRRDEGHPGARLHRSARRRLAWCGSADCPPSGKSSQFWFAAVSDNYFSGLGVVPAARGRCSAHRSGSPVHVVLGHATG